MCHSGRLDQVEEGGGRVWEGGGQGREDCGRLYDGVWSGGGWCIAGFIWCFFINCNSTSNQPWCNGLYDLWCYARYVSLCTYSTIHIDCINHVRHMFMYDYVRLWISAETSTWFMQYDVVADEFNHIMRSMRMWDAKQKNGVTLTRKWHKSALFG